MHDSQFSLVKNTEFENQDSGTQDSDNELDVQNLSGDEAIEKSFMSGVHSIQWSGKNKASLFLSTVTVVKSMVGVGILGIPNLIKNFGMVPSLFVLGLMYACSVFTVSILIHCKNLSGHSNYSSIGFAIYKHKWILVLVNCIIIFTNLGTCLGELIILGTTCNNLVESFGHYEQNHQKVPFYLSGQFFTVLVGLLITPLLLVKSIEKLRFVSLVAITAIASFTVTLVYNFFHNLSTGTLPSSDEIGVWLPKNFDPTSAFSALPGAILAYNWQFNLFPVYKGMVNPTDKRALQMTVYGATVSTVLYVIVGYAGYASYGASVQVNFLQTLSEEALGQPLYIFLNLAFTLSTTLTLPIIFFGSRNNLIQLLNSCCFNRLSSKLGDIRSQLNRVDRKQRSKIENIKFFIVSITVQAILLTLACLNIKLDTVFNIVGAVGCNSISYGLPSLFYYKLVMTVRRHTFKTKSKQIFFFMVQVYLLYSVLLVLICLTSELLKLLE